jgi:hypothetical protein
MSEEYALKKNRTELKGVRETAINSLSLSQRAIAADRLPDQL